MSGFRAVNTTTLTLPSRIPVSHDETTPTTPRQNRFFAPDPPLADPHAEDPTAKTPTRDSFNGISGQKPLPSSPFKPKDLAEPGADSGLSRGDSYRSNKSADSPDAGMDMEDEEADIASDNESVSDSVRPSKKKKGQRFFCKDYPPCQLSFTRSEHLARHIRKHTGERPFQCHCSRRFSRLDNLRQHAQTVHVNEDIPDGSLAATGTRFQRQIRTDRVRPPGNRSRASTLGSQGTHSRGHSRNLSTSSIASMASTASTMSQRDDFRRPPVTLGMADDGAARARLSLDTFNGSANVASPGNHFGPFGTQSPSGIATPASSTYSTGTGSPRFSSGMHSPVTNAARSFAFGSSRTPGRRTSLPSSGNPFQPPQGTSAFGLPFIAPLTPAVGTPASGQSSMYASPTSSTFSNERRESLAEADLRRRTWHPSTQTNINMQRPATSGLSYFQTPDAPQPVSSNQPAASQVVRLPGIESFDHAPAAHALIRRQPSPMQIDPPARPSGFPSPPEYTPPPRTDSRRNHISWDVSLNRGLNKLDITSATPPTDSQPWSRDGQGRSSRPSSGYFGHQPPPQTSSQTESQSQHQIQPPPQTHQPQPQPQPQTHGNRFSNEPPVTPRRNKRMGWYAGPPSAHQPQPAEQQSAPLQINHILRTSPEDSSGSEGIATPASSTLGEYQPAIVNSHGEVEQRVSTAGQYEDAQKLHQPTTNGHPFERHLGAPPQSYASVRQAPAFTLQAPPSRDIMTENRIQNQNNPNDMRRLEALVAVATREDKAFPAGV